MQGPYATLYHKLGSEPDSLRTGLIAAAEKITGRPTLSYVGKMEHPGGLIVPDDIHLFDQMLRAMGNPRTLDLVLHTPGGVIDATENIVRLVRDRVDNLRVLVPHWAKSAGTLMCLAGDEILMSDLAELGPTDPQIVVEADPQTGQPIFRSAWSILNTLKELESEWKAGRQAEIIGKILESFDATQLDEARKTISLARKLAEEWMTKYMGVSSAVAKKLAADLADNDALLSHGRPLRRSDFASLGNKVKPLDGPLWDVVLEYFLRAKVALLVPNRVKILDSNKTTLFSFLPS